MNETERPRFTRTRIYLCCSVLLAVVIGATDPSSLHHDGINIQSLGGMSALCMLALAALFGLADTIGHDLMGLRSCFFRNLCRLRFLWLMGLALMLMALVMENTFYGSPTWAAARYALDAIFAASIAGSDVWDKFKKWMTEP